MTIFLTTCIAAALDLIQSRWNILLMLVGMGYDPLQQNGVVVEDVPEEEDEELCDIRHRRNLAPSPGQWMEPVEE
eukprot:CAMPEP_0183737656 /NCGR_PEP_ID=MMETSP0737-20130205/52557_1 /TAXON_ID=385413 /ORGANISM="Thalassiosira miniscula, Strain CCMP1093" /LENGTH=74 /DNA_ID=CAMNT_0025971983 /DNA_START=107 /DNA_END=331 /DNA_ORIENTATION=-